MFDVRDFGAVGDGLTLDTRSIQAAVDACGAAGGGTIHFGAGAYVTGSLFLRDHTTLHLEAGAILLGSEDPADYPVIQGRWEGVDRETYAPLIGGHGLEGIAIQGRGTVDGRGAAWWQRFRESRDLCRDAVPGYPRPRLISFADCHDVLIEGVTLIRSPSWTIHPLRCDNVTIDKVTVANPPDSPNTDGINPDSCRNVHISNCHIDVGDDCIALKSGTEDGERDQRTPCESVAITNCTMVHGHGGVVMGSEMSGGISISMAGAAEPGYPEMADDMELMQRAGLYVRHVRGLRLRDVEITGQQGPAVRLIDVAAGEEECGGA